MEKVIPALESGKQSEIIIGIIIEYKYAGLSLWGFVKIGQLDQLFSKWYVQ